MMRLVPAVLSGLATSAEATCRLALVLAIDVSGSVDADEYRQQMNGIAAALEAPDVTAALLSFPAAPVSLYAFEWSASSYQREIFDWQSVATAEDIEALATRLRTWRRIPGPEETGIGAALVYAAGALGRGPACWREVIDLASDGRNNDWPPPRVVRRSDEFAGVTINGLAIGNERPHPGIQFPQVLEITDYFRIEILQGPGSFVETAASYQDYEAAMTRKLLREVEAPAIGQSPDHRSKPEKPLPRAASFTRLRDRGPTRSRPAPEAGKCGTTRAC